jgi:hypothetical protein
MKKLPVGKAWQTEGIYGQEADGLAIALFPHDPYRGTNYLL